MAEYLFKNLLCKYNCSNICCESAGVYAQNGNGASVNSFVVLKEIGIDLGLHKSKNIFTVNLKEYDLFVTMNKELSEILSKLGISSKKIYILNEKNGGILDPFGEDITVYRKIRDEILSSIKEFFSFIQKIKKVKNLEIISARKENIEEIYKIETESFSDPWSISCLEDEILSESSCFLVAISSKEILGYILGKTVLENADILKLATKPQFKHFGIAKRLLNEFIRSAAKLKIQKVVLEVRVSNTAAINLYKNTGFRVISTRKGFYSSPKENAYLMQKDI